MSNNMFLHPVIILRVPPWVRVTQIADHCSGSVFWLISLLFLKLSIERTPIRPINAPWDLQCWADAVLLKALLHAPATSVVWRGVDARQDIGGGKSPPRSWPERFVAHHVLVVADGRTDRRTEGW
jgi:hypothetical protein